MVDCHFKNIFNKAIIMTRNNLTSQLRRTLALSLSTIVQNELH